MSFMRKFIVAPTSYKGYLLPKEVAAEMKATIEKVYPNAEVISLPLPDGGEGTLEAYLDNGYLEKKACVCGPEGNPIEVSYGLKGKKAFLESASCLALSLVVHHDPRHTSSFGLGELIIDAIANGAKDITISLGGTSTNDGGAGMALALGARFFLNQREYSEMHGSLLSKVNRVDLEELRERIEGIRFHCLSDVANPLLGPEGASRVYGPQKGATPEEAIELDEGMAHYAELIEKETGISCQNTPGAGAAGGLGFGCLAFLKSDISSGCEAIMKMDDFDEKIKGAEALLTGEGHLDQQSLMGKSLSHILAHKKDVPIIVIAGEILLEGAEIKKAGITAAYSLKGVEETPLTPERVKKALFRVTYDALIVHGHRLAKKYQENPDE